jgi:hypothetical protein
MTTTDNIYMVTYVVNDCINLNITYAISAYHHWCCEFESRSVLGVQHYVIKFVSDLVVSHRQNVRATASLYIFWYYVCWGNVRCGFIVMHFLKRTSIHCVSGCSNCLQQQIWIYFYVFSRTSSYEVQSVVDVLNRKPNAE